MLKTNNSFKFLAWLLHLTSHSYNAYIHSSRQLNLSATEKNIKYNSSSFFSCQTKETSRWSKSNGFSLFKTNHTTCLGYVIISTIFSLHRCPSLPFTNTYTQLVFKETKKWKNVIIYFPRYRIMAGESLKKERSPSSRAQDTEART